MPYLSYLQLGDPDVGVDLLYNIPCNPTYGGVVIVTLTTLSNTPDLPFLLTVSANSITIQYATDGTGQIRVDEYPTNYNSGIAAAIAASPAAALVEMLVFFDDVNDQTPFETPLTMGLVTSPGPNSNGASVYVSCTGGGSAPASYIYGG